MKNNKNGKFLTSAKVVAGLLAAGLASMLSGCGEKPINQPTNTPTQIVSQAPTAEATKAATPTSVPKATVTPMPTSAVVDGPTNTPAPTNTPVPGKDIVATPESIAEIKNIITELCKPTIIENLKAMKEAYNADKNSEELFDITYGFGRDRSVLTSQDFDNVIFSLNQFSVQKYGKHCYLNLGFEGVYGEYAEPVKPRKNNNSDPYPCLTIRSECSLDLRNAYIAYLNDSSDANLNTFLILINDYLTNNPEIQNLFFATRNFKVLDSDLNPETIAKEDWQTIIQSAESQPEKQ